MKTPLYKHTGNAIILRDMEKHCYVGIAYVKKEDGEPMFATCSSSVTSINRHLFCLLLIIETLELGLKDVGIKISEPIILREENMAIITGDGEHYAVGVSKGHLQHAYGVGGTVTDELLTKNLASKMRCTNRD